MPLADSKLFELQQTTSSEKKRKPPQLAKDQTQLTGITKKSAASRISAARQTSYNNSSSCPSGSDEEIRCRAPRTAKGHQGNLKVSFPANGPPSMPYQGKYDGVNRCSVTIEAWNNSNMNILTGLLHSATLNVA